MGNGSDVKMRTKQMAAREFRNIRLAHMEKFQIRQDGHVCFGKFGFHSFGSCASWKAVIGTEKVVGRRASELLICRRNWSIRPGLVCQFYYVSSIMSESVFSGKMNLILYTRWSYPLGWSFKMVRNWRCDDGQSLD